MRYKLYLLLENVEILGEKKDFVPVFGEPKDSVAEVVNSNELLSFMTDEDVECISNEFKEHFTKYVDSKMGLDYSGELGGIWAREFDGLHYLYRPEELNVPGVYAIAIGVD